MACNITQADLGALAANLDSEVAEAFIATATSIVLGPEDCQAEKHLAWLNCCVDACTAIKLLAQHLIAADPTSGAGSKDVISKSLGDASVTYANVSSSSGLLTDTVYGRLLSMLLAQFEQCRGARSTFPLAVGGCSC